MPSLTDDKFNFLRLAYLPKVFAKQILQPIQGGVVLTVFLEPAHPLRARGVLLKPGVR